MPVYPSAPDKVYDLLKTIQDLQKRVSALELDRSGSFLADGGADGAIISDATLQQSPTSSYGGLTQSDAPILWVPMSDPVGSTTANDTSGHSVSVAATGVIFGALGPIIQNPGETGALFDGVASRMFASLNPTSLSAFSVEVWINLNSLSQTGSPVLVDNSNPATDHAGFRLQLNAGTTPSVIFGNGTTSATVTAPSTITNKGWHFIAATWDGTTITLYVDGVSVATGSLAGPMPAGTATGIGIGFDAVASTSFYHGLMGHAAVYDTAQPMAEQAAKYQEGTSAFPVDVGKTLVYNHQPLPINTNGTFDGDNGLDPWAPLGSADISAQQTGSQLYGQTTLLITPNGTDSNPGAISELCPISPGQKYSVSGWTISLQGWATVQVGMNWYDANQTFISQSLCPSYALTAGVGTLEAYTAVSPTNAAYAAMVVIMTGTPPKTTTLELDTAYLVKGDSPLSAALNSSVASIPGYDQFGNKVPAGANINLGALNGSLIVGTVAAGTVDALSIASGTIVAGIVDTTTIHTATLVESTTLGYASQTPRGPTLYDFESSVQGWVGALGSVATSTVWSYNGQQSLLLTPSGAGSPAALSPNITVVPGDSIYLEVRGYCPPGGGISNFYCGIQWIGASGLIYEADSLDTVIPADTTVDISVADVAPAGTTSVRVVFGNHGTLTSATLIYADYIEVSGNLAFSFSAVPGTDPYGFNYEQGISINALPGLQSVLSVYDGFGDDILANLDSSGNFTGQIGSFTDVFVSGQSILNDILPQSAQGCIARTNVFASNLPAPGTPTSSEFYLYELDVQLTAGRSYLFVLEPMWLQFSGAGGAKVNMYATTDGTQPTNASPLLIQGDKQASGSTGFSNIRTDTLTKLVDSSGGALWRILVSFVAYGTGSTPTLQLKQMDTNPGDDTQVNARLSVYDMGISPVNTGLSILSTASGSGGSGGGTKNYTKTYTAQHTYSYQGSDGGNSNLKIGTDGKAYQGGDFGTTYNGKSKTWIVFNTSAIVSDLSGATITKVEVYLNNNHSWYGSGMTACIGWDNKTSFGSTAGDPSGTGIDISESHFNEGQAKWVTVANSIGTNYQNGNAKCLVLFRNSNNLTYYGYFAGGNSPQLRIHYTK